MRTTTPSSLSKPPPEPVHPQGRTPLQCLLLTQGGHCPSAAPDHFQAASMTRYDPAPCADWAAINSGRRPALLRGKRPRNSKAEEGVRVRGPAKEPGGGAQDTWRTAYGAAAPNMLIAIGSNPGTAISWSVDVIVVPTIFRPLRHITMHLIEAPGIGIKRIDRQRLVPKFSPHTVVAVYFGAFVIGLGGRNRRSPPERRRRSASGHVFALGLARQPVALCSLLCQPGQIGFDVIPSQVQDGVT